MRAKPLQGVATARLQLFGTPRLCFDSQSLPLPAERRFQLLVHLAARDDWVTREQAMALLWPDLPAAAARRNLRGVLHELRVSRWPVDVASEGQSLRWSVASDLRDFRAALLASDWMRALDAVQGPFVDGFEHDAPEPFVQWLRFEREMHVARWRDAVEARLAELEGDAQACLDIAQTALAHDPLNESLMHALLRAQAALNRPARALDAYRTFAARLLADTGATPSAALAQVAAALDATALREPSTVVAPHRAAGHARFVGRRSEKRELVDLVKGGECRWVTVLGSGGVGKTSLADVAAAALEPHFADGVVRVELRDLASVADVAARAVEAIGATIDGAQDALGQLAERLGARQCLVVLDNCEHVPGLRALCERLVADCPRLRLLLTSRMRLGGRDEWIYPLGGLPVPDEDERDADVLRAFDSVQLFESRARRLDPAFDLAAHAAGVCKLTRAVDGLPLALELAAASMRVLGVEEIADHVVTALDAVGPDADDDARERSLRASFDHSWRLARATEREALARLSIFAGDFGAAAASEVADAPLPTLASLVDQSLVRALGDNRFSLHPLVRQYARARLHDVDTVRARHAAFFGWWLSDARAPGSAPAESWLPDVVAAWRWGSEQDAALIERMAEPLLRALDRTGRWREGLALFEDAAQRLAASASRPTLARADVARCAALLHYRCGGLDAAEACARDALRIATTLRSTRGAEACLNLIGGALRQRGRWEEARRYFERALRQARASRNAELVTRITNNIATVEMATGHLDSTIALCQSVLDRGDPPGDAQGTAMTLIILGNAYNASGDTQRALAHYERGLELCERHRLPTTRPFFLQALGTCHREQGRHAIARTYYERTLDAPGEVREPHVEASALLGLAQIDMADGRFDAARALLDKALRLAARMRSPTWQLAVILRFGECHARQGDAARAVPLLALVSQSPLVDASVRPDADTWLATLGLDADEVADARTAARVEDLDAVVARLLAPDGSHR